MEKIKNYINGEMRDPSSGEYLENINPALGSAYSLVGNSNAQDAQLAIEAAKQAFPQWSNLGPEVRAEWLEKLADLIEQNQATLAELESIDNGKPLSVASSVDIPRAAKNLRFFARAITQFKGEFFQTNNTSFNYTQYQALGPVTCISPWNLPLYLLTWKIAPALAMGNTVVAKPSEVTPMTAYYLAKLCQQANLPPGVLNIIHGEGKRVSELLTTHPDIKAISFTGSTATGRIIAQQAAPHFKKLSLEMGGKNPSLVFADCDFDKTVDGIARAAFSNQGQICLCGSRIFVEASIYEKFKQALVAKIKGYKIGNPLEATTHMGALVSKAHMEKVLSYIELAQKSGGKILCGGNRVTLTGINQHGYFVAPTLIEGLSADCQINQDEIFGPVATIMPFQTEKEVLEWANNSRYGLAANIWTQDLNRAHKIAQAIQTGIVWINTWMSRDLRTPFGGVKESGVGREGGEYALRFFSEVKNINLEM